MWYSTTTTTNYRTDSVQKKNCTYTRYRISFISTEMSFFVICSMEFLSQLISVLMLYLGIPRDIFDNNVEFCHHKNNLYTLRKNKKLDFFLKI